MARRAFAHEDGNLNSSIVVTRQKTFSDVDIDFSNVASANNVRTDIVKRTDVDSIKQSVKNILLTNPGEKPFMPLFGAELYQLLFELDTELDEDIITEQIENSIEIYEPRALIRNVHIKAEPDANSAAVTVEFQVINTGEFATVDVDITRIR